MIGGDCLQKISQPLNEQLYGTCMLELEKRIQSNQEISVSTLEAIPLSYLSSSAILLNYAGKRYLDNGDLFKSRELLTLAIKKFAAKE